MKVLQLVTKPQRRGAEIFAYDLSRQFEVDGVDVKTVYLYDYKGEGRLPLHETDICLGGSEDHFLEGLIGFHPGLLYRVRREIRRFMPDIVQVNGSRTVKYGAAAKQLSHHKSGWKLVYRNIGIPSDWHKGEETILAYRFMIMPKMDGMIGVSRASLLDACSLYRLNGPSTVIPNGVSPARLQSSASRGEIRASYGVGDDEFVLLFFGYLEEAKRPDRFINVLSRVVREFPSTWGWIVGDGPMSAEARRLAKALGVEDRTRFFGNQKDVANFLTAADLLVLTSDTEGVPATVLEAAYLGLPVVATNVGGLSECVRDGVTGILAESDYEESLSQAVLYLARNERQRSTMAEKAQERAHREFTIECIASRYLNFYNQISGLPLQATV